MVASLGQTDKQKASTAFTLVEVVMAMAILALVMAGMIYGYVQTNYRAEWSSMSVAAQSFATRAVEQLWAAEWDTGAGSTFGQTSYSITNQLLIPGTGQSTNVVTTVSVTNISTTFKLAQIRADCVWYFPGKTNKFVNTVITWRTTNQYP